MNTLTLATCIEATPTARCIVEVAQAPARRRESLPFRVRIAQGPQDLSRAVEIRSSAYSRHLPHVADTLRTAEAEDIRSDVLLLIAERKLDRRAIGTLRLESNLNGPLRIEHETELPSHYRGCRLVEVSRLGIENGSDGILVTASLAKAAFAIFRATGIDHAVCIGRRSMLEIFRFWCFESLAGPLRTSFASHVPLWIFAASVAGWEAKLRAESPRYHDFMVETEHPDIVVDNEAAVAAFGRD